MNIEQQLFIICYEKLNQKILFLRILFHELARLKICAEILVSRA